MAGISKLSTQKFEWVDDTTRELSASITIFFDSTNFNFLTAIYKKRKRMSFVDSDCYDGFTNPQNFGIITFGGAAAQNNHYFVANGNSGSTTRNTESIASRFIAGVPMRLFRLTCHKSTSTDAEIHVVRDRLSHVLIISGNFHSRNLENHFMTLSIGDVLQVRSRVNQWFPAPGAALISLYFYPLSQQTPLYSEPESALVNIMTFSGANVTAHNQFLRFNGNLATNVNANVNDAGNYCIVGEPMVVHRIVWQKSTAGVSTMVIRGTASGWRLFDLDGPVGVTIPPRTLVFNVGDVISVQAFGDSRNPNSGTCTVSFYAKKS
jgi:hypothetical protein